MLQYKYVPTGSLVAQGYLNMCVLKCYIAALLCAQMIYCSTSVCSNGIFSTSVCSNGILQHECLLKWYVLA